MINVPKTKEVLQKALTFNLQPTEETFPELPTVLIWFRFVLAIAYGLYVGTNLLRSGPLLLQALNLIAFAPTMYAKFYLGVKGDVFASQIVFAGLPNAIALCVLIWVYLFTLAHSEQEAQLSALLVSAVAKDGDDESGEDMAGSAADAVVPPVADSEEPEF